MADQLAGYWYRHLTSLHRAGAAAQEVGTEIFFSSLFNEIFSGATAGGDQGPLLPHHDLLQQRHGLRGRPTGRRQRDAGGRRGGQERDISWLRSLSLVEIHQDCVLIG